MMMRWSTLHHSLDKLGCGPPHPLYLGPCSTALIIATTAKKTVPITLLGTNSLESQYGDVKSLIELHLFIFILKVAKVQGLPSPRRS